MAVKKIDAVAALESKMAADKAATDQALQGLAAMMQQLLAGKGVAATPATSEASATLAPSPHTNLPHSSGSVGFGIIPLGGTDNAEVPSTKVGRGGEPYKPSQVSVPVRKATHDAMAANGKHAFNLAIVFADGTQAVLGEFSLKPFNPEETLTYECKAGLTFPPVTLADESGNAVELSGSLWARGGNSRDANLKIAAVKRVK